MKYYRLAFSVFILALGTACAADELEHSLGDIDEYQNHDPEGDEAEDDPPSARLECTTTCDGYVCADARAILAGSHECTDGLVDPCISFAACHAVSPSQCGWTYHEEYAACAGIPVAVVELAPASDEREGWDPDAALQPGLVYLDGSGSYDSIDPEDESRITEYTWTVVSSPAGTSPEDIVIEVGEDGTVTIRAEAVGEYVVQLVVTNIDGEESVETVRSEFTFEVRPAERLAIQLTWDTGTSDQDVHVTYVEGADLVCGKPYDVHWRNRTPVWFGEDAPGKGANPSLDVDDTDGLGPERVSISSPVPGTYRVYVHYWGDFTLGSVAPTTNTLRIFGDGIQRYEVSRVMDQEKQLWQAVDIVVDGEGEFAIVPVEPDVAGEFGRIGTMESCDDAGFVMP